MIEDAIRYQLEGDNWIERVLIGGGVLFLGIFIIPLFTLNGYMVEVMRRVLRGETSTPPEWGDVDLVELTVDGVKQAIIAVAYGLLIFILAGIPVALFVGVGAAADVGSISVLGFLVGVGIYLVGSVAMLVILPVATANFVTEDRVGAGFDLGVIRTLGTNRTMLMAVVFAFVVNVLMSAVTGALGFTLVGYLAVPFVFFVGQSAIFYIWAEGFADAYEEAYGEPPLGDRSGGDDGGVVGSTDDDGPTDDTGSTDGVGTTATEFGTTDDDRWS